MMTYYIPQHILAVWIILASTTCKLSIDAQSIPNLFNANQPPTPLCVYPPPTSLSPPPATLAPPTGTTTPPPYSKPDHGVWCVAKPTVAPSVMQTALDYACGSGADCEPIQAGGACYQPATLVGHAAYAFNSYWQKNKKGGGTCDFGGSAMIVTVDPSYGQCHYIHG